MTLPVTVDATRPSVAELTEAVGGIRHEVRILDEGAGHLHHNLRKQDWTERTTQRARSAPKVLLDELAGLGFAWSDLAKLVGVSVPALQKWRRGEKASGENRHRVAGVLAACDLISEHYLVEEVASWFETPMKRDVPLTPITLWADGRADLVFEYAGGHASPDGVLDRWNPDWREWYRSEFEVFDGGDGVLSLRPRQN